MQSHANAAAAPRFPVPVRHLVSVGVTLAALVVAVAQIDLEGAVATAMAIPKANLAVVVLALASGALLASARLAFIAADIGFPMRARDAIAAMSLGQIGGALFFQVFGQTIARSAVLSRRGVPVAGTILMTGYERLLALAISMVLAMAGGWYLFGRITLDLRAGGAEFVKLLVGVGLALAAGAAFAWGRPVAAFARGKVGPGTAWRTARGLLLSAAIQLATMAAYIAAALGVAPGMSVADLAAAAAVVMLAASLPISFAGWGVRELSAIYALGAIGMPREGALVVAVLIGAAALAVVALLAAASALRPAARVTAAPARRPPVDVEAAMAWGVPVLAATTVFFQVHVPLAAARLNVNLADPLVIFGGALFLVAAVRSGRLPRWRLAGLNAHIAAATVLIVAAFLHGWAAFGWTEWAFVNRLVGWLVVLAYAATGALIAQRHGGRDMLLRCYAAVAIAIVVLDTALFSAFTAGLPVPETIGRYRLEGFAQNANAFALQLLFAVAAVVAVARDGRIQGVALGVAITGIWFTSSRAGIGALAIVALAALWLRAIPAARVAGAVVGASAAIVFISWLPEILAALLDTTPRQYHPPVVLRASDDVSNLERLESMRGALAMFEAHPIFGAGLGAFVESYIRAHGTPLVIHSTPLWILAEMGVVGLLVLAAPFIRILKHEIRAHRRDGARVFLILVLVGFAVMASVHELMYQRALWLLLGAALAVPPEGGTGRHGAAPGPAAAHP